MRAAQLFAPGEMRNIELERPEPGPGEVLIRVEACGICGSDRHMFKGEYPTAKPVTLGHEFSGIVAGLGAGVTALSEGDRVAGDPNVPCGRCSFCRDGKPNHCTELKPIGVMRNGGFAEYVVAPADYLAKLPADLNPLHGAFCEPVSCCVHAIDVARIRPGNRVAIIGGGVIGLLMVELVKREGAGEIVLSTRQAARRALALELGATHSVDPSADGGTGVLLALAPEGYDVVIECAGTGETFLQSMAIARKGGTVVPFGVVPQDERVMISPFDLLTRELRVEPAWLNPRTLNRAAELIASGALSLDRLVTRTIGLGEVPAAIGAPPAPGEIKVIAVP
jgi:2-desacetyl-2-hydroxyethyl bacteriochlorophyllide A dehydrogenase